MTALPIVEHNLQSRLQENFAKLVELYCFILWQQQGIYIRPYESVEKLAALDQATLQKGIRSVLMSFETLRIQPETYLQINEQSGVLEERMSITCEGADAHQRSACITDLLFRD